MPTQRLEELHHSYRLITQLVETQHQLVLTAHRERMSLYHRIGSALLSGSQDPSTLSQMSRDLTSAFPEIGDFSITHLKAMRQLAEDYPELALLPVAFLALSWSQLLILFEHVEDKEARVLYAEQSLRYGWSSEYMRQKIGQALYPNAKKTASTPLEAKVLYPLLLAQTEALAYALLPSFMGKAITQEKEQLVCGSLRLYLVGEKRGKWFRFSQGKGGDLFALIGHSLGLQDFAKILQWASDWLEKQGKSALSSSTLTLTPATKAAKHTELWEVIMPVPLEAEPFEPEHHLRFLFKDGKKTLETVYGYRNMQQALCGYVVRIRDKQTGEKETLPVVYAQCIEKNRKQWRLKGFGENRPLYNEHLLGLHPAKPVLIVEGEKTANAAAEAHPEWIVICWSGGAHAYHKSHWSVLKDREVTIWPDNDEPGLKAAEGIQTMLLAIGAKRCSIVDIKQLQRLPESWDLADPLPEHLSLLQVTSLLYRTAGIYPSY
jgi:hypothetical protein